MGYELTSLDASIVSTFTASCVVGGTLYALFEFNRHVLDIYAPRLRDQSKPPPPAWKPGLGQWLTSSSLSEDELKTALNLDAWVVLLFLKFCYRFCFFSALFGMIVLWPTYVTSQKEQAGVHGVSLYTMAHLDAASPRLWVPTVCTWLYASVVVYLLTNAYAEFVDQRMIFLLQDDAHVKPQKRFSVMVKNIPHHLIKTSAQLKEMFEELFPNKVYSANLVQPIQALELAIKEREKILTALELATASFQASGSKQIRPTVRLINAPPDEGGSDARLLPVPPKVVVGGICSGLCCAVGEQKDAIDYYNIQLTNINMTIRRLRCEYMDAESSSDAGSSFPHSSSQASLQSSGYLPPPSPSHLISNSSSEDTLVDLDDPSARHSNFSVMSEEGIALSPKPTDSNQGTATGPANNLFQTVQGITDLVPLKAVSGWAAMAVQGSSALVYDGGEVRTTTGFVTFSSRTAWLTAHRLGTLSDAFPDLCIQRAPGPEDIIWTNLHYSTKHSEKGQMISGIIFRLGLIFWGSLISVVTAMSNMETLEEYFPFIEDLDSFTYALLAGLLPVVLMALLLASVPLVIAYFVKRLDRLPSVSSVHKTVFHWVFGYLLANMFVSIVSGSIYGALEDFVDNPKLVLSFLADSFPNTSVLFCNYVISVTLIAGPNELLQILSLLEFAYYTRLNREAYLTKRKLFASDGPLCKKYYPFGGYLPQYAFVLTIVLFFSVISPLVPLVAFFFFLSRYFILRHQFLYVYTPEFSMGGRFWYSLSHHTMQALLLFSVTMLLYTVLKQGFLQGLTLLPLPFVVWYQWERMDVTFGKVSQDIAYVKAMQDHAPSSEVADHNSSRQELGQTSQENDKDANIDSDLFSKDYYLHPALLAPIDACPLPYRLHHQPLLGPSEQRGSLCPCCSLISREVTPQYLTPLEESADEGVTPLVGMDFLDSSMLDTDLETDQSKSERIKYSIDYSY